MLFTSLAVATAAVSKWLIAGKIMATVGTGLLTAGPAIERMKKERRQGNV